MSKNTQDGLDEYSNMLARLPAKERIHKAVDYAETALRDLKEGNGAFARDNLQCAVRLLKSAEISLDNLTK